MLPHLDTSPFPAPSADELAHSARLADLIRADIRAHGSIPFWRFMELALYAPGLGYYSAGKTKFGVSGDFITAPELGSLFARCVARTTAPVMRAGPDADFIEVGGGSGAFAAAALAEWERLGCLPQRYRILDRSNTVVFGIDSPSNVACRPSFCASSAVTLVFRWMPA